MKLTFTLPLTLSPSMVAVNATFITIGLTTWLLQNSLLPSPVASLISVVELWPLWAPVILPPYSLSSRMGFCGPLGDLIVAFHFCD